MKWEQSFIDEVRQRLAQMGWKHCGICGSADQTGVSPYPFLIYRGGVPNATTGVIEDEQANVEFFLKIECNACGHAQFVNAAKYRTDDEPTLRMN